jgi:hypothetical protein
MVPRKMAGPIVGSTAAVRNGISAHDGPQVHRLVNTAKIEAGMRRGRSPLYRTLLLLKSSYEDSSQSILPKEWAANRRCWQILIAFCKYVASECKALTLRLEK